MLKRIRAYKNIWAKLCLGLAMLMLSGSRSQILAQPPDTLWARTYGGSSNDCGNSVWQTSDGGYIIVGGTQSYGAGGNDVWLIKTDSLGNEEWDKTFGGEMWDHGYAVRQTSDGGYIVLGTREFDDRRGHDLWLIKTDSLGNKEWDKTFGNGPMDAGYSFDQTRDDGYIITGFTTTPTAEIPDAKLWLIKTDSLGNKEWETAFEGGQGGYLNDIGYSVQETWDGGYIITGDISSGNEGLCLIKTDSLGNKEWDKTFGEEGWGNGHFVRQTLDGGYIIIGERKFNDVRARDFGLIKTDSLGNKEWDKTFGGIGSDGGSCVQQTSDGGYIITGETSSYGAGGSDAWLIKTDSLGNKEWDKILGGTKDDIAYSVQQTSDSGYIIVGKTGSYGAGGDDIWLIKVASDQTIGVTETSEPSLMFGIELSQPNPVNGISHISYHLPISSQINLKVYSVSGKLTKILFSGKRDAGSYRIDWDTKDLFSGIYFLRLEAGKQNLTKKVVIVK